MVEITSTDQNQMVDDEGQYSQTTPDFIDDSPEKYLKDMHVIVDNK